MNAFLLIALYSVAPALPAVIDTAAPHYEVQHIPIPKGYRILSAHYTKYGAVVGEIRNGEPTTNAPNTYGPSFAFIWRNKRFQTLRVPKDYATAEAIDASADGRTIIGNASLVNDGAWLWENRTGVVWRNKTPTKLVALPDQGGNTEAIALGSGGSVMGYSWTVDQPNLDMPRPVRTACKWTPSDDKPTPLDDRAIPSRAVNPEDIKEQDRDFRPIAKNAHGDIVGVLEGGSQHRAALLRGSKKIIDINLCLAHPLPSGKSLVSAEDIDNRGWIIAVIGAAPDSGRNDGETVLLKPSKRRQ